MKLVYVEEVFTLSFHAWEFHVKTSVSIDIMKRGCILDTNHNRKKELNFRISGSLCFIKQKYVFPDNR